MVADEATHAGSTWNGLVLDEKTGKVKTNVQEIVNEATKDFTKWNEDVYKRQLFIQHNLNKF